MHATPTVSHCSTASLPNHRFSLALAFAAGVLGLMLLASASTQAQKVADEPPKVSAAGAEAARKIHQYGRLELRQPVEHEIAGGQTDEFTVEVQSGQFLHVVAEQKGIDIAVSIIDPNDKKLVVADSPNGSFGPEPASIIAKTDGIYRVQVSALDNIAPAGRYSIELTDLRVPAAPDEMRIQAERQLFEAATLLQGDLSSQQKAVTLLGETAELWRSLQDGYEQALTSDALGSIYSSLGEKQKALVGGASESAGVLPAGAAHCARLAAKRGSHASVGDPREISTGDASPLAVRASVALRGPFRDESRIN